MGEYARQRRNRLGYGWMVITNRHTRAMLPHWKNVSEIAFSLRSTPPHQIQTISKFNVQPILCHQNGYLPDFMHEKVIVYEWVCALSSNALLHLIFNPTENAACFRSHMLADDGKNALRSGKITSTKLSNFLINSLLVPNAAVYLACAGSRSSYHSTLPAHKAHRRRLVHIACANNVHPNSYYACWARACALDARSSQHASKAKRFLMHRFHFIYRMNVSLLRKWHHTQERAMAHVLQLNEFFCRNKCNWLIKQQAKYTWTKCKKK